MDLAMVTPYLYQYGLGSVIFFGALVIARASGALELKDQENRRTFYILLVGMAGYAVVHALLQFVFPFMGV